MRSASAAAALGGLGFSASFIAFLKSRIDLPSVPPTSPSLLGPKSTRMIASRINKWVGAKRSIIVETVLSRRRYDLASFVLFTVVAQDLFPTRGEFLVP